jgi:Pyruvate/2-oxoacid:ferredoxin oxidoreductase delta subunit
MAVDVFERLATRLDSLPNGFPRTESGVELRILRAIFSAEDAAMALRIKPLPETAGAIARRLKRPVAETKAVLDRMAERGQIASFRLNGKHVYAFVPFVVGIYEFQLERLTKELADLFEEYAPTFYMTLGGSGPALARVVPVNTRVEAHAQILPHEDLSKMLGKAKSFRVGQCICRKEKAFEGRPCSHTQETCLSFSREENAWDDVPSWGRPINRDEAVALLAAAEREGLVHCTYNTTYDPFFVCNCCSCCCGFLRGMKEFDAPYVLAHASVVSVIDGALCTECGECAAPRCPMDAIAPGDAGYRVDATRCIGCGVCLPVCPTDAIALVARPAGEVAPMPKTVVHWAVERDTARHGVLHGLALRGWLAWEVAKAKLAGEPIGGG